MPESLKPYLALFGAVLMTSIVLFRFMRRRRAINERNPKRPSPQPQAHPSAAERKHLEGLLVDIHDTSRELHARVDNQLRGVSLLAERNRAMLDRFETLEERIAMLQDRVVELEKEKGIVPSPSALPIVTPAESPDASDSSRSVAPGVSPAPIASGASEPVPSTTQALPAEPVAPSTTDGGNYQHQYHEIYARADQGESIVDIAEKTGHQQGEVELILRLRQSQQRA